MSPSGGEGPLSVSIILPVLDEAAGIGEALNALEVERPRGAEIIVVDGGSSDATVALATPHADRVLVATRGRASQMNVGARAARSDVLLFLHADTRLPSKGVQLVRDAIAQGAAWGRFDVSIAGRHPMLPVIATMMNLRSRLTGIATGDQAIFVRRDIFLAVGGFAEIELMEDVALSAALRQIARPACLRERVVTSGRRWDANGAWSTILLMWRLRLLYALGASPAWLAWQYRASLAGQ